MSRHSDFVRSLPCCVCGKIPPSQWAHVRRHTDGGMSKKPSDKYTVPLCHKCHIVEQHSKGENSFWGDVYKVIEYANELHSISGDREQGIILTMRFKAEQDERRSVLYNKF